jgi:hypothetical protein
VEEYLRRYGVPRRHWDPPEPDDERPETEWGFEPALREDVEGFARERGYRVRRIVFEEPERLSPSSPTCTGGGIGSAVCLRTGF